MKPTSGQLSARGEQAQRNKGKAAKGKKVLPNMTYLKSVKTFQPIQSYPPWTGDEANTFKVAAKPIFDDQVGTQMMTAKYPNNQKLVNVFPSDAVFEDPESPISFRNPEADSSFSSALFLILSKGLHFFEKGTFQILPHEINPSAKYVVKMYENNNPVRLIFDDKIPVEGEENKIALLQDSDPKIMLPTLLHKAFLRFIHYDTFTSPEVITAFTGLINYEVPLEWSNLLFWFGRPDALVALYIKNDREGGLGSDRLFHILDVVEVDQHRKFVKLQCPGAQWRGRFSGFEEDTKHWTNQIRVLLEIDPETAATAGYFWMILEDLLENFDSIMVFAQPDSFKSNLRRQDVWIPKEHQFYVPPAPTLLKCTGTGKVQLYCAPLPTSAPTNNLQLTLSKFSWNAPKNPIAYEIETTRWKATTLDIDKNEVFELTTNSRGGYVMQMFSNDVELEFIEYKDITCVTSAEGDLPFYVSLDEFAMNVFPQRFELIGKVLFNLDQPGNVSFAISVTNPIHRPNVAALLFNNDTNDVIYSSELRCRSGAVTPNKNGYTLLIFGVYGESINGLQPVDLVGKWRARIFSDVPLSDVVDTAHLSYTEVEGDAGELDEGHQIQRHVLSGGCEAVVLLETSQPLSLSLSDIEDEKELNAVRGVGFCVLPSLRLPGDKDPARLIVRSVCSESASDFGWKLRIFSTAPVTCKEDTAPAEKTAAAIAAWEKKRTTKPPGKKSESKSRSSEPLQQLAPATVDPNVLHTVEGDPVVLSPEDVEKLIPAPPLEPAEVQAEAATTDQSESLREAVNAIMGKMNEEWDGYDGRRAAISKMYTPPPPVVE